MRPKWIRVLRVLRGSIRLRLRRVRNVMKPKDIIPDFFSVFFMFPFGFHNDQWKQIKERFEKDDKWEYRRYKINSGLDYNEYVYFYPYIRKIVFASSKEEKNNESYGVYYFKSKHFDYPSEKIFYEVETTDRVTKENDTIKKEKQKVSLPLRNVFLHLFDTGVGILIFEIWYDQNGKKNGGDPYRLNDFLFFMSNGRRVYLPFIYPHAMKPDNFKKSYEYNDWGESNAISQGECPTTITIIENERKKIFQDFRHFEVIDFQRFKKDQKDFSDFAPRLSVVITHFLDSEDHHFSYSNQDYWPIIDDRMFSHSYFSIPNTTFIKNQVVDNVRFITELKKYLRSNQEDSPVNEAVKLWYQLIFADRDQPTCQNDQMMKDLIKSSSYNRWSNYGSFYGFSRFSSVIISDYNEVRFIYNHFQTMYYQIAVLLFYYRGALLSFSRRSEEIARQVHEGKKPKIVRKLNRLHQDFILFRNKYWFREVTPQDQGIEIFDMWSAKMRNNELLLDLEAEIRELYNYFNHIVEKKENRLLKIITWIGVIGLPLTILTGFFGMNLFQNSNSFLHWPYSRIIFDSPGWTYFIFLFIGFYSMIGIVFLFYKLFGKES